VIRVELVEAGRRDDRFGGSTAGDGASSSHERDPDEFPVPAEDDQLDEIVAVRVVDRRGQRLIERDLQRADSAIATGCGKPGR
jgi:hypothetical protein